MLSVSQSLGVQDQQQEWLQREVQGSSSRRAFGFGILVGSACAACVSFAMVALFHNDASGTNQSSQFVSAAGYLRPAQARMGHPVGLGRTAYGHQRVVSLGSEAKPEGYGASHTSFYTDAVKKDSYPTLDELLEKKVADKDTQAIIKTMFDGFATITELLRKELVTVAEKQESVFGDVQLGVDVEADNLMWDICKTNPLIKEGASEEEPEVRVMHDDGKFSIVWDPLDGSSIVDNNWAVGTIVGIWPASSGIMSTGREQVTSLVALYGPRTTVFVVFDDGVYEFTYGANGYDGWLASKERIQISKDSKIFSPANMRAAQEDAQYDKLLDYWKQNRYTLRYTGGLVPDICQQFTKGMGVFVNPTSEKSPAKLRLAFEAAPFGLLVEKAGGKTSDGVSGGSILDVPVTGIDQRTPLAIGSANEVDRFNEMVLK